MIKKLLSNIKWGIIRKYNNRKHFYFEIHLVDHCNLNCASCTHFSPISNEWYIDVNECKRDLLQMKKIFGFNYAFNVRLMGGEPLLHPEINCLIKTARESLPKAKICLVTNGILLKSMSVEFWNTLKNYDVALYLSSYPIDIDYGELVQLAQEHGITVDGLSHNDKSYFGKLPIDTNDKRNAKFNFKHCPHANNEHNLRKGRLYTCMTAANIEQLNNRYNLYLPEENGLDIYQVTSKEEVFRFMKRPTSMCKFCVPEKNIQFKWHRSKKEKEEWLLESEE